MAAAAPPPSSSFLTSSSVRGGGGAAAEAEDAETAKAASAEAGTRRPSAAGTALSGRVVCDGFWFRWKEGGHVSGGSRRKRARESERRRKMRRKGPFNALVSSLPPSFLTPSRSLETKSPHGSMLYSRLTL